MGTLLTLEVVGRGLALPKLNVPDFIDFTWQALLPFWKSGWGMGWAGSKVREEELWLEFKMNR